MVKKDSKTAVGFMSIPPPCSGYYYMTPRHTSQNDCYISMGKQSVLITSVILMKPLLRKCSLFIAQFQTNYRKPQGNKAFNTQQDMLSYLRHMNPRTYIRSVSKL